MDPRPRFTGIFIPSEILEIESLGPSDIILLSWIDALHCKEKGGCYASNKYFSERLHLKENTIKVKISKLVDLGLVERVSFDGRERIIRSCKENWYNRKDESTSEVDQQNSQSTAEVDLNQRQGLKKINGRGSEKSTPLYIYSKEYSKDKNIAQTRDKSRSEQRPDFTFCSSKQDFIGITDEDLKTWKSAYPNIDIPRQIALAIEWLKSNPAKANKKLWRKFLTGWFRRADDKAFNQQAYRSQGQTTRPSKMRPDTEKDTWKPNVLEFSNQTEGL